jgi:hypothetical protein
MIKLKVLHSYKSRDTQYQAGQVIEVTLEQMAFLTCDAPGCFAVDIEDKAPAKPPKDKMVKRGKTK